MSLRRGAGAVIAGLGAAATYQYQTVKGRESQLPSNQLTVFNSVTKANQQRVLIIGAGVVGVSTAYKLAQRGHKVVVLEPAPEAGEECSACAAGGMSRQNVVVDRSSWIAVLKCLAPHWNDDFQFFHIDWLGSLTDPFFLRWATTFTKTSLLPGSDQEEKQQHMLKFTKYAVDDMVNMMEDPKDNMAKVSGYNKCGSLGVSYDPVPEVPLDPTRAPTPTHSNLSYEPNRPILSTEEVLQLEPSLKFQKKIPTSAKFEYDVKAASSGRFSKELARRCANDPSLDVTFLYDTKVQAICTGQGQGGNKPRISELKTNQGVIQIPEDVHIVIAAGAWTPHIMALMDCYAPVYPLKGYAMSVSAKELLQANPALKDKDLPSRIVCDKFMYTTRLGDEIRITSIGEFSEWDTTPTPHVDELFRHEAIRQFPQLEPLIPAAKTLCGFRPFVSDGILLLGATDTHDKVYVTCGPGSNGWKLAMGSADIIARLVSGEITQQIQEELGFDAEAFSPAGRVLYSPLFAKLCRARWGV